MLEIDRDQAWFQVLTGGHVVEALDGYLIVRDPEQPLNTAPTLRVPLR